MSGEKIHFWLHNKGQWNLFRSVPVGGWVESKTSDAMLFPGGRGMMKRHFSFKIESWGYRGPWFQLWQYQLDLTSGFWVIASGILARSACWGAFGVKIEIFIQRKSQNKLYGLTDRIRKFDYDIYFVTLNDLGQVTLKSCFLLSRVTWGTSPISDFYNSKYFPMICLSRQKIKKVLFYSKFCIWCGYASVFCVYSKGG